jgi:beta-galactoside alpha-2,3-sialyltransferase (sialyltransferase 4A)
MIRFGIAVAVLCVGSGRSVAQDSTPPTPASSGEVKRFVRTSSFHLKTNSLGHLQRKLQESYPDSFSEGVDVFWEPRDGWVSADVLDWWRFQVDGRDLNPQAAERLFSQVNDESRVFSDPREREICAVIGPSRNLLGSGYGNLIDAHDVVIRMNRAPRDGFETDVGSKTTHHVTWPIWRRDFEADRRAFLLVTPITLHADSLFDQMVLAIEGDPGWDPRRVRIINPEFVKYVHENWLDNAGLIPSTGFIALMIAAHVCDEINVFGFGADADGRWDHYFNEERAVQSDLHGAVQESDLRRELEDRRIIKVYLGNRSEHGVDFSGFQIDEIDQD